MNSTNPRGFPKYTPPRWVQAVVSLCILCVIFGGSWLYTHWPKEPTHAGKSLKAWVQDLQNPQPETRKNAAKALRSFGPDGKAAVPDLIRLLKDRDAGVQAEAVETLRGIGTEAKGAVPDLTKLLKDQDSTVQAAAARVLAAVGPDAKAAVPDLIDLLKNENLKVQTAAADALGAIGPDAKPAVPVLVTTAKGAGKDGQDMAVSHLRRSAVHALGRIGGDDAFDALRKMLGEKNLRDDAADTFGDLGAKGTDFVPDLLAALKGEQSEEESSESFRVSVAAALWKITHRAEESLWVLIRAVTLEPKPPTPTGIPTLDKSVLEHSRWERSYDGLHRRAADALEEMGPEAKPAVSALRQALSTGPPLYVEIAIRNALKAIDPKETK